MLVPQTWLLSNFICFLFPTVGSCRWCISNARCCFISAAVQIFLKTCSGHERLCFDTGGYCMRRSRRTRTSVGRAFRPGLGCIGEGRFADAAIEAGHVVLHLSSRGTHTYTPAEWMTRCANEGIPVDGAIFTRGMYMTDWYLLRPAWYSLNHRPRRNANLVMSSVRLRRRRCIVWVACVHICEGDELTFDYGDAPAAWT